MKYINAEDLRVGDYVQHDDKKSHIKRVLAIGKLGDPRFDRSDVVEHDRVPVKLEDGDFYYFLNDPELNYNDTKQRGWRVFDKEELDLLSLSE